MSSGSDLTITITAIVTIVGGFGVIAKAMLAQASKDREADRQERIRLSNAIEHMAKAKDTETKATQRVAVATERAAKEAADRNGHLAEQHGEIMKSVENIANLVDKR